MSTFVSPADPLPASRAQSSQINNLDAATAAAFALLPDEDRLSRGTVTFAVDTGVADAYLVSLAQTPSGYVDGLQVVMRPINNNTGACTINVNSIGVKAIKTQSGTDPLANEIVAGSPLTLIYSTATGYFHINPNSTAIAASATASAVSAAASAASAAAALDEFTDIYLGAKAADPTLDNDGNALAEGALYFNTTTNLMKVYSGSEWLTMGLLDEVDASSTGSLSAGDCRGKTLTNYGQVAENTQTLPTCAVGMNGVVTIGTAGAGAFHLKAGPSDKIYLDDETLDNGDKASLATPAVGDNFSFLAFKTGASSYDWIVRSGIGTLSDGGA